MDINDYVAQLVRRDNPYAIPRDATSAFRYQTQPGEGPAKGLLAGVGQALVGSFLNKLSAREEGASTDRARNYLRSLRIDSNAPTPEGISDDLAAGLRLSEEKRLQQIADQRDQLKFEEGLNYDRLREAERLKRETDLQSAILNSPIVENQINKAILSGGSPEAVIQEALSAGRGNPLDTALSVQRAPIIDESSEPAAIEIDLTEDEDAPTVSPAPGPESIAARPVPEVTPEPMVEPAAEPEFEGLPTLQERAIQQAELAREQTLNSTGDVKAAEEAAKAARGQVLSTAQDRIKKITDDADLELKTLNAIDAQVGDVEKYIGNLSPVSGVPGLTSKTLFNVLSKFQGEGGSAKEKAEALTVLDSLKAAAISVYKTPGSGQVSDKDIEIFLAALPGTGNLSTANFLLLARFQDYMKARREYATKRNAVVQKYGDVPESFQRELNSINDKIRASKGFSAQEILKSTGGDKEKALEIFDDLKQKGIAITK